MELLSEISRVIVEKLPSGVQSYLKELQVSDLSVVLGGSVLFVLFILVVLSLSIGTKVEEGEDFGEYKRGKKDVQVKVNTPNPKKNLKRGKKKKESATEELKGEENVKVQIEEEALEEGWEIVKPKKPKKKDE